MQVFAENLQVVGLENFVVGMDETLRGSIRFIQNVDTSKLFAIRNVVVTQLSMIASITAYSCFILTLCR